MMLADYENFIAMSNSINPDQVPVSTIEDSSLTGNQRMLKSGRRFHKCWLGNMDGAFLTLLDREGRILFFAAGALRRRVSKTADQVVSLGMNDLLRGLTGEGANVAFQPDYRVQSLEGPERHQDFALEFREIPFMTTYLGRQITEANSWGILRVGPSPGKLFEWSHPVGTNTVMFIDPRTWKESATVGAVPGSGSNDLTARLAPRALEIAENYPSAWTLAVTSAYLFGGMTIVPKATPIKKSSVVNALIDHEVATRKKMKEGIFVRERMTKMKILIDGSNVQRRANNSKADLDQLISLCLALFKEGYDFIVYIDANTRHKYPDDQAKIHLNSLLRECPNIFVENGGLEADDFLLNRAKIECLPVLTNDQFRQKKEKYPFVSDQSRFIRFSEGEAPINIPSLGLLIQVQKKKSEFHELRSLLGARMVRIVDSEGHYVWCASDGGILKANAQTPEGGTTFRLVSQDSSRFALLAPNRKYVSANINLNASLVSDQETPGEWEIFTLHETESGIYLRAHNQLFVSSRRDEGKLLRACSAKEDLWERFRIEDVTESFPRFYEGKQVPV